MPTISQLWSLPQTFRSSLRYGRGKWHLQHFNESTFIRKCSIQHRVHSQGPEQEIFPLSHIALNGFKLYKMLSNCVSHQKWKYCRIRWFIFPWYVWEPTFKHNSCRDSPFYPSSPKLFCWIHVPSYPFWPANGLWAEQKARFPTRTDFLLFLLYYSCTYSDFMYTVYSQLGCDKLLQETVIN